MTCAPILARLQRTDQYEWQVRINLQIGRPRARFKFKNSTFFENFNPASILEGTVRG
jgi:hypothetical protein